MSHALHEGMVADGVDLVDSDGLNAVNGDAEGPLLEVVAAVSISEYCLQSIVGGAVLLELLLKFLEQRTPMLRGNALARPDQHSNLPAEAIHGLVKND